jgi:hypothetical protein
MEIPNAFEKHGACNDTVGMLGQILQYLKFARLQLYSIARSRHRPLKQIDFKVAYL